MAKVLFIHNRCPDYRLPLFLLLKEKLANLADVEFWIYQERRPEFSARYFFYWEWRGRRFSPAVLWSLWEEKESSVAVVAGAYTYEVPLLFWLAKLKRKKIIFWTEAWDWGKKSWKNRLFFALTAWMAKKADQVVYSGRKTLEFYERLAIAKEKMSFAPNASLLPMVTNSYFNKGKKIAIVYLGRLLPQKGLHILIEAFRQLDQRRFVLFIGGKGDESYEAACRKQASGLNVYFFGEVKREAVGDFINMADVFVYPSVNVDGACEAWGMALGEAVSLGKGVVATTAVAAAFDLIEEGNNGFVIAESNLLVSETNKLRAAIEEALALPLEMVIETSKRKKDIYSFEKMAEGFYEAIKKIL